MLKAHRANIPHSTLLIKLALGSTVSHIDLTDGYSPKTRDDGTNLYEPNVSLTSFTDKLNIALGGASGYSILSILYV